MNRLPLAAALLAFSGLAAAQSYNMPPPSQTMEVPRNAPAQSAAAQPTSAVKVDVAKPNCEPKPVYPSGAGEMRVGETKRKNFERDLKNYKECMMTYIELEKASTLAHQDAYKNAVDSYNTTMKAINEAQEANR